MDLNLSPEEEAFRRQVSDWLRDNVPRNQAALTAREAGEDKGWLERAKSWQGKLFQAGSVLI